MKYKLFYGLWGCSSNGILHSPTLKYSIKLPVRLAFRIHTFLNSKFAYARRTGEILLFGKVTTLERYFDIFTSKLVIIAITYWVFNGKRINFLYHRQLRKKKYKEVNVICRLKKL